MAEVLVTSGNDEAELLRAAAAGDDRAFEHVFVRHRGFVRSVCARRVRNPHDIEDAVQDTFLKVFRALPLPDGHDLRAWLYVAARHVCIDRIRQEKRRPPWVELRESSCADLAAAGPDELVAGGNPRVDRTMTKMPDEYRAALELRYLRDLSHREMGTVLAKSPGQIKALVHRATRRLRVEWATA